jgi:hypothetical protein
MLPGVSKVLRRTASIIIHAAGVCSYLLGCTSRLDIIRADRRVLLLEV